jgi:hypothetical protein
MVVPTACVDLEKIVPAPAYQVSQTPASYFTALFSARSQVMHGESISECILRSLKEMIATGSAN